MTRKISWKVRRIRADKAIFMNFFRVCSCFSWLKNILLSGSGYIRSACCFGRWNLASIIESLPHV